MVLWEVFDFGVVIWQIQRGNWVVIWGFCSPCILLNESLSPLELYIKPFSSRKKEKEKRREYNSDSVKSISTSLEENIKGVLGRK